MEQLKSQEKIMHRLKTRGPQSVKILANQLGMTTMGIRQHLADLEQQNLVTQTRQEKQNRGRPVHHWRLTQQGHQQFPDSHAQITLELIGVIRNNLGENSLHKLIEARSKQVFELYRQKLEQSARNPSFTISLNFLNGRGQSLDYPFCFFAGAVRGEPDDTGGVAASDHRCG